jgi:hypothetical protein
MTQNYAQLPEDEKEKDRVVARAMLQAITGGQQGVAEVLDTPEKKAAYQAKAKASVPALNQQYSDARKKAGRDWAPGGEEGLRKHGDQEQLRKADAIKNKILKRRDLPEPQGVAEGYWDHKGFGVNPYTSRNSARDSEHDAEWKREQEIRRQQQAAKAGTWYIRVDGKIWRKNGEPVKFEGEDYAMNVAKKIHAKDLSKEVYITRKPNDTVPPTVSEATSMADMIANIRAKNPEKFGHVRIHGYPGDDKLMKQDEIKRQQQQDARAEQNKQAMSVAVEKDRAMLPDLKAQLAELEKTFDPHYEYSDDYTLWSKQKAIASNIQRLRDRIAKSEGSVSESNHPDEKEDKALIRKMVKPKALKKEDHSTASGGWGQGARPAIDVSSKLIGQGHNDAIHENPDWYSDEANSMSTAQLKSLVKHAAKLRHAVKQMQAQGDTLEPWQQAKVTKASDYLDTVFNAVDDDHDMGEDKSVLNIDNEPEMASALRKGQTVGMAESDEYISELYSKLSEKIAKNAPVKTYIDDFEKAAKTPNAKGHHQFKNKSPEKVRQMAIAASYGAKNPSKKKK